MGRYTAIVHIVPCKNLILLSVAIFVFANTKAYYAQQAAYMGRYTAIVHIVPCGNAARCCKCPIFAARVLCVCCVQKKTAQLLALFLLVC
jgi:hypothetical protein